MQLGCSLHELEAHCMLSCISLQDELEAHCLASEDLARFKRPRAYRFVDKLPMTPTGKKKHVEATAMACREADTFVRPRHH